MSKKSKIRLLGRGKKSSAYRGSRKWHKAGGEHCRKSKHLHTRGE